jgi:hypothetical protein
MVVAKVRVWRKYSKIDNDDWMIGLNQSQPFISVGCEDLPYKQHFTIRNQAELLILPEIGKTRLDRPSHPVRPPRGPGLTGLPGPSRLLPNLGVNTCPPVF